MKCEGCGYEMPEMPENEACPCCWAALTEEARKEKSRTNVISFIMLVIAPVLLPTKAFVEF